MPLCIPPKKENPDNLGVKLFYGAGDGNRTRVTSLEGWSSTIELHLQFKLADHTRFELVIFSVTGRHVRPLHQWSVAGINISHLSPSSKENIAFLGKSVFKRWIGVILKAKKGSKYMDNEAYKVIMNRHSCRKFLDKEVPDELIDKVVAAGLAAPTGRNSQQTYFLAVKDPEVIEEIRKLNAAIMGATSIDPFYGAKALIVVLHAKDCALGTYDGSIAMAQMMIAAESLGLGSTWIHRAKEVFALPEGKAILYKAGFPRAEYVGVGNLILGYPDECGKNEHSINPGRVFKL